MIVEDLVGSNHYETLPMYNWGSAKFLLPSK
jgi:hypothetical protein